MMTGSRPRIEYCATGAFPCENEIETEAKENKVKLTDETMALLKLCNWRGQDFDATQR